MRIRICLAVFAIVLLAHHARADVNYAEHFKVEAAGAMSMADSEGSVINLVSSDKSRTESTMTMKSKLVSMFAGSGKSGNIVRLDKALTWTLLPDQQQYSELTFAQVKAQMDQARQAMKDAQAQGQAGGTLPVSAEGCQWTDGEVHVEHPAGTEEIAGFTTQKHIIRKQQSCTDPTTAKTCDITWLMETWLAKEMPGEQEVRMFQQSYAKAMGIGDIVRQSEAGQSLLAMFGSNWEDVGNQFKKLQGYPLRTVMQMGIGGEQCTTAAGKPITTDEVWAGAGHDMGSAVGSAAGESLGGSMAGAIGSAVGGELIGGLTGMFSKKEPEKATQQPQATAANGQVTVFRITSETTNWSNEPIPQERFDIPVGWRKL